MRKQEIIFTVRQQRTRRARVARSIARPPTPAAAAPGSSHRQKTSGISITSPTPRTSPRRSSIAPSRSSASTRISTACAICWITSDAGRPLHGFLFYSSSEIHAYPAATAIPTPDLSGNVSCTGPRAWLRASTIWRDAARRVCQAEGNSGAHGAPVQQPGPVSKITDGRVIPTSPRIFLGRA